MLYAEVTQDDLKRTNLLLDTVTRALVVMMLRRVLLCAKLPGLWHVRTLSPHSVRITSSSCKLPHAAFIIPEIRETNTQGVK